MKQDQTTGIPRNSPKGIVRVIVAAFVAIIPSAVSAAVLEWDADLDTLGVQGGDGRAGAAIVNPSWGRPVNLPPITGGWWDGTQNVPWVPGSDTVFGSDPGTVDVDGLDFGKITFTSDYLLKRNRDSNTINYPSYFIDGLVDVASAGVTAQLGGEFFFVRDELVKEGPGTLIVGYTFHVGTHPGSPAYVINEGTLATMFIPKASPSVKIGANGILKSLGTAFGSLTPPISGAGAIELEGDLGISDITSFEGVIRGGGMLVAKTSTSITGEHEFTGGFQVAGGAVRIPMLTNSGVNGPSGAGGVIALGMQYVEELASARLIVTQDGRSSTNRPFLVYPSGGGIEVENSTGEVGLLGPFEGEGTLVKAGPGRLTLEGDKAFTGSISVEAGSMNLQGSLPGDVTVHDAGVVETGVTSDVAVRRFVLDGGNLALGGANQVGSLGAKELVLERGLIALDLERPSGNDQLKVDGAVFLNGYVSLTINLEVDPEDFADVFRLVLNDGTDITRIFDDASRFVYEGNVLEEGETFLATSGELSQYFQIHYGLTAEDNDVRLVAAPEPGTAVMLVSGALCLLGRRRRSKAV